MSATDVTLAGFTAFLRANGFTTVVLPDNSPSIPFALSVALMIVNPLLACVSYAPGVSGTVGVNMYTLAVYNFATDRVVNFAQDQTGQSFFLDMRKDLNIAGFVSGVLQATNDETTSDSFVVQEAAKNFTLSDIQRLKTPWGRQYLEFAQSYGEIVGIS